VSVHVGRAAILENSELHRETLQPLSKLSLVRHGAPPRRYLGGKVFRLHCVLL